MNNYQKILLGIFIIAAAFSAVGTTSGANWLLEISPALAAIPITIAIGRKFKLSNFSYTLVFVFLLLPLLQAHYGVAHVPFGEALGKFLGSERNMFDRVTHFSFGFLLSYPLYEIAKQNFKSNAFLHYYMPASLILSFSAIYEMVEWMIHEMVSARLSFLFVAAQADLFDAARDMFVAFCGTIITLGIIALRNKKSTK